MHFLQILQRNDTVISGCKSCGGIDDCRHISLILSFPLFVCVNLWENALFDLCGCRSSEEAQMSRCICTHTHPVRTLFLYFPLLAALASVERSTCSHLLDRKWLTCSSKERLKSEGTWKVTNRFRFVLNLKCINNSLKKRTQNARQIG